MKYAIAFYALISLVAFVLYGADKRKAKKRRWRIPESVLLGVGLLGGCLGALLGMKCFRHKTRHFYFWVVHFFALLAHGAAFYYFFFLK